MRRFFQIHDVLFRALRAWREGHGRVRRCAAGRADARLRLAAHIDVIGTDTRKVWRTARLFIRRHRALACVASRRCACVDRRAELRSTMRSKAFLFTRVCCARWSQRDHAAKRCARCNAFLDACRRALRVHLAARPLRCARPCCQAHRLSCRASGAGLGWSACRCLLAESGVSSASRVERRSLGGRCSPRTVTHGGPALAPNRGAGGSPCGVAGGARYVRS